MCGSCGAIYNLYRDGLDVGDRCPACAGELYLRSDDRREAILNRLEVYKQQTQPLIDYYQQRSRVVNVDGEQGQQQASEQVGRLARGESGD